jgi:hypothetical protein
MKLVLSRKGFDTGAGGGPSPILPDGRLVSLPIPEPSKNAGSRIGYHELRLADGRSYADLLAELGLPVPEPERGAHLDPDLAEHVVSRPAGWRPAFGQVDISQQHLANEGVGVGDVFVFFGYFCQTVEVGGRLRWDRKANPVHAMFGYLQVGEVVDIHSPEDVAPYPWAAEHPHVRDWQRPKNTLYIASERLSLIPERPGAGLLRWSPRTCLTKRGPHARSGASRPASHRAQDARSRSTAIRADGRLRTTGP